MPQPPCSPCRREVVGHAWVLDQETGNLVRQLLRECVRCKDRVRNVVYLVNTEHPVCGNCLGQNITATKAADNDGKIVQSCADCACTDIWVLSPEENYFEDMESLPDEDEDDDGYSV